MAAFASLAPQSTRTELYVPVVVSTPASRSGAVKNTSLKRMPKPNHAPMYCVARHVLCGQAGLRINVNCHVTRV
eukprot:5429109-Amphidinium_carterae.1